MKHVPAGISSARPVLGSRSDKFEHTDKPTLIMIASSST